MGSTRRTLLAAGANATDEEFDAIIEYLVKSFEKQNPGSPNSDGVPTKLDVNRASTVQLGKFLGLSISEAAAVVRFREENGKYNDLEDLKAVRGLDLKKIEANKDRITF
jgi:competence protein ComEA